MEIFLSLYFQVFNQRITVANSIINLEHTYLQIYFIYVIFSNNIGRGRIVLSY